ncbi:transglycosylase SLT domain-containing protein [Photobacterium japonica]|uniref:transglycosylase SLT domain-containing protein n=1 Tax=Photobacterium japonica TaxID=2910235 RepID=UPI003D0BB16E
MKISCSVGLKGKNRKPDVELVQEALNRATTWPLKLLSVDGICGANTRNRIKWFQKEILKFKNTDSLVDVDGKTWKLLSLYITQPKEKAKSFTSLFVIKNILIVGENSVTSQSLKKIAWGSKVSQDFKEKVIKVSKELGVNPDFLMACMAFETGETFSPKIRNAAGSGATGLIQFMPSTAKGLGTTTDKLAKMTAVKQLDYVKKYFLPYRKKIKSLEDVYMAILYPAAIGRPASHALFKKGTIAYKQNSGLDKNKDGNVTLREISSKVTQKYHKGLKSGYIG